MKMVGTLGETPFIKLMLWVSETRFSGTLVLASEEIKKSFIFDGGKPVSARSNIQDESLGAILVAEGKLTPTQLQKALQVQDTKEGVRSGEALISMGLIDHAFLNEALRRQFLKRFNDLFRWPVGKYGFVPELPADVARIDVGESLPELCYRGLIEKHKNSPDLAALTGDVKPMLSSGATIEMSMLKLVGREMGFFRSINGVSDLKTLLAKVRMEEPAAKAMLLALRDLGVLRLGDRPSSTSPGVDSSRPKAMPRPEVSQKLMTELSARLEKSTHQNYYEVLDVDSKAASGAIKNAYFELAKVFHPDRLPIGVSVDDRKVAEAYFSRITEAHATLGNSDLRKEYDAQLDLRKSGVESESVNQILESELEFQKGQILIKKGDFTGAIALLTNAIKLYDQEPEYFVLFGWATYRDGKKKQSSGAIHKGKEAILKAVKEKQGMAEAYYYLGVIEKNDGEPAKAKQHFQKCLEIFPKHPEANSELRVSNRREEAKPAGGLKGLFGKKG